MGADLYIRSKNPKIWGFERSEQAVDDGYFRDPYNDWSVLWKYGLSWWTDITPMLNKEGELSVANTKKFLKMLDDKVFEEKIASESENDKKDYREGATLLKKFLNDAIKLKAPIEASL
jgi:hypothetical protein